MKALLVTSRVTFVPENYDRLILGLSSNRHIGGLLVLDNGSWSHLLTSAQLLSLGAKGMAVSLLKNAIGISQKRRKKAYAEVSKPFWVFKSVNEPGVSELVKSGHFDLIINARTRCIFKDAILKAPRLGCINIHHGLLPDQRGTMCDLWSLYRGDKAGFSIHKMTSKIDAGDILARVVVAHGGQNNYLDYLSRSSAVELKEVTILLDKIAGCVEAGQPLKGEPNIMSKPVPHCRNPTPKEIRDMLRKGIEL